MMMHTWRTAFRVTAGLFMAVPLLSQTPQTAKPSFDVVSIKPSAPNAMGMRGGGTRGNRYNMTGANLRMLVQQAYREATDGPSQLEIVGGPNWIDSDRYDIQATVDCSGGILAREQVQLMVQSMLEDRFQLKAHFETRELPIYNLVLAKDGPKIKVSEDQTPPRPGGFGPPQPCGPAPERPAPPPPPPPLPPGPGGAFPPNVTLPRGAMMMMMSPTGMMMQASGVPLANLLGMLTQQVGRPVIDKTDLKGLFDFTLRFSPEGLNVPLPPGGLPAGAVAGGAGPIPTGPGTSTSATDPVPSIFTAIQDLGLKLESAKGSVRVLVIDSVQKPKEN